MKLQKCPRCELNYVRPGNDYCDICLAELDEIKNKKKQKQKEIGIEICPECNENPVVPGQEMCKLCLIEKRRLDETERMRLEAVTSSDEEDAPDVEDPLEGMIEEVPDAEEVPLLDEEDMEEIEEDFEDEGDLGEIEEDFDEFDDEYEDDLDDEEME